MSLIDNSFAPPVVLNFNSKDRISGSNSSFQSKAVDLGLNKYNAVCLVQASIPKSWYNMPNTYNKFILTELGVDTVINVPIGSYTKINLATSLKTALDTASPNGWIYTVNYPAPTQPDDFKYTFSVSGNSGNQPSFTFDENSPFRQLGFDENQTYTFVLDTLKSVNAINLSYVLRAFIKSDIIQNSQDGILEEFLNVGSYPPQSIVFYQQIDFQMNTKEYNPNNLNSWTFSLVDSYDKPIDTNGVPWAFSLVFFQRSDTHELHKNELLIKNEERIFRLQQEQEKIKNEVVELPVSKLTSENFSEVGIQQIFETLPYPDAVNPFLLKEYVKPDKKKK